LSTSFPGAPKIWHGIRLTRLAGISATRPFSLFPIAALPHFVCIRRLLLYGVGETAKAFPAAVQIMRLGGVAVQPVLD